MLLNYKYMMKQLLEAHPTFEVVDEQRVTVRGAQFLRYLMRKKLDA